MEEKTSRYAVDRNDHDREHDAGVVDGSRDHNSIDEIGHSEQVPQDGGCSRVGFTFVPPVGNDRSEQTRQRVPNAGRNSKHTRHFTLPPPDEKDTAENPENLDPNQPVLRNGGNDGAEIPR